MVLWDHLPSCVLSTPQFNIRSCRYYSRRRAAHCLFARATGHHRTELGSRQEAETRGMGSPGPRSASSGQPDGNENERALSQDQFTAGWTRWKCEEKHRPNKFLRSSRARTFNYELVGEKGPFCSCCKRGRVLTLRLFESFVAQFTSN